MSFLFYISASLIGGQAKMKFVDLISGSKLSPGGGARVDANHTSVLTFPSVSPHHSGKYMCQVSNGIGRSLHQIVSITIKGNFKNLQIIVHLVLNDCSKESKDRLIRAT